MRTIVHLSDLHTGRLDPAIVEPLVAAIRGAAPDLVVLSGDLTQRATNTQFVQARAFLDALGARTLTIPGNHDVPLWNVAARFLTPLARYRHHITSDLSPVYEDPEIIVAGVNTARSLTRGEGRISDRQVQSLLTRLRGAGAGAVRIVVTHHPFDLPPGVRHTRLLGRADRAMALLAAAGADLFLSGHLHVSHISHSAERYRIAGHSALIVQAGTVSRRGRGEPPAFNILQIERPHLTLWRRVWDPAARRVAEVVVGAYRHEPDGWKPAADAPAP